MAITRSQIARQLLAEGGAPRIPFRSGGGRTDANTMSGSGYGAGSSSSDDGFGGGDDVARPTYSQQLTDIQNSESTGATFPGLSKVTPRNVFGVSADNPMLQRSLFERAMIQMIPGIGSAINLGEMNAFNVPQFRYSNTGGIDDRFKTTDDDDNNQIVRPMMPMVPKLPTDIEPEKSDYTEFVQRFTLPEQYRLADGGDVRQAYGLGSIVKKVTGAVKKVAKSDIGKAALLATGAYFAPAAFGGTAGFGAGSTYGRFFSGLMNPNLIGPLSKAGEFGRFLSGTGKGKAILGIGAATLASGVLSPKQEEEADSLSSRIADKTGLDIEAIRKEVQTAYANNNTESLRTKYPFLITESAAAAEGGRIGFENGGYSFEQFKKDKFKVDQFMGEEQMRKMYEEMMRKKRVAEQRSMVANGGDIDEAPKEEGIMMASYGYDDAMSDTYDMFLQMKEKKLIPPGMDFQQFLQEVVPEMSMKKDTSGMMASAVGDESDDISRQLFGKGVKDLTPDEFKDLQEEIDRLMNKFRGAKGGIASMAEGGMMDLGGNEMDLRGGGFVPLGVAEKADDVPARLSKNEFVFTADAVRAAGGGSVDKGADLMYKTMKQLENKVA